MLPKDSVSPRLVFHRVDLHNNLLHLATHPTVPDCKVRVELNKKVTFCDSSSGTVETEDGAQFSADLIVGADGIHSRLREIVIPNAPKPQPTGTSAYRILTPISSLEHIPEAKQFMKPLTTMVIGGDRRVVMGPCRNGTVLSIVALVPDGKSILSPVLG